MIETEGMLLNIMKPVILISKPKTLQENCKLQPSHMKYRNPQQNISKSNNVVKELYTMTKWAI